MRPLFLAPLLAWAPALSFATTPDPLAAEASPATVAAASVDHPRPPATSAAARVADALPKFVPRPSTADASPAAPIDLREVDRPRNTILRLPRALLPPAPAATPISAGSVTDEPPPAGVTRLPRYDVHDRKVPALKNRELLTPEAKIDLQFKKHPALRIGNIFGLNRGIAALMAAEDENLERRTEMSDLLSFQKFADAHPARDPDAAEPAAAPSPTATSK